MADPQQYRSVSKYDRIWQSVTGRSDVTRVKATNVTFEKDFVGRQVFVVETVRVPEEGDYVSVQYMDADEHYSFVLPPKVVNAFVRQRDALTVKAKRKAGKEQAAARKARGEMPAFLKVKKA
jgi:hypothetical protein